MRSLTSQACKVWLCASFHPLFYCPRAPCAEGETEDKEGFGAGGSSELDYDFLVFLDAPRCNSPLNSDTQRMFYSLCMELTSSISHLALAAWVCWYLNRICPCFQWQQLVICDENSPQFDKTFQISLETYLLPQLHSPLIQKGSIKSRTFSCILIQTQQRNTSIKKNSP